MLSKALKGAFISNAQLLHSMRKVLITGGSSGLGKRIAQIWSQKGHQCHIVGRNEFHLKETLQSLSVAKGQQHTLTIADVQSDMKNLKSIFESVEIDTVVHAAGVLQSSLCVRTSEKEIDSIICTNLVSAIKLSKMAILEWFRNKNSERDRLILNISSRLSTYALPGTSVYAASKAGLESFTKVLAAEVASKGIRVNAISPGYVDTPMLSSQIRAIAEKKVPIGRLASTDEIVDACTFLLDNRYTTGTILPITGGL